MDRHETNRNARIEHDWPPNPGIKRTETANNAVPPLIPITFGGEW